MGRKKKKEKKETIEQEVKEEEQPTENLKLDKNNGITDTDDDVHVEYLNVRGADDSSEQINTQTVTTDEDDYPGKVPVYNADGDTTMDSTANSYSTFQMPENNERQIQPDGEVREKLLQSIKKAEEKEKEQETKKAINYAKIERMSLVVAQHIITIIIFVGLIVFGGYKLLQYFNII